MLVAQNDSRVGFGHCGIDWSDGRRASVGRLHAALLPVPAAGRPCGRFLRGSDGDLGLAGQRVRRRGSPQVVTATQPPPSSSRSPTPGIRRRRLPLDRSEGGYQEYRALPLGVVANINDPNYAYDKALITADASPASPKRDNVYVTWTQFGPEIDAKRRPDGIRAVSPIYFRQSTDGGATWSAGLEINGTNAGICGALECSHNQGSHPVIGPDGTIYVSFANRDAQDGIEQVLFVKCPPSARLFRPRGLEPARACRPHLRQPSDRSERRRVSAGESVPASERVRGQPVHLDLAHRRSVRESLRRLGRLSKQHEPTAGATPRRQRRPATTTSSTPAPPTAGSPGASRRASPRAATRASGRRRSGNPGAPWRATGTSGSRSTTAPTAIAS